MLSYVLLYVYADGLHQVFLRLFGQVVVVHFEGTQHDLTLLLYGSFQVYDLGVLIREGYFLIGHTGVVFGHCF